MVGILAGLSFGQAPKKTSKPATLTVKGDRNLPPPKVSDFPGEVVGNIYQNRYFNIKIVLPESWLAQGPTVNAAIKTSGSDMISGKTKVYDKAFDDAVNRTTVLFTTTRDILGMQNNAIMVLTAEKTPPLMQVRDGRDYLRLTFKASRF